MIDIYSKSFFILNDKNIKMPPELIENYERLHANDPSKYSLKDKYLFWLIAEVIKQHDDYAIRRLIDNIPDAIQSFFETYIGRGYYRQWKFNIQINKIIYNNIKFLNKYIPQLNKNSSCFFGQTNQI